MLDAHAATLKAYRHSPTVLSAQTRPHHDAEPLVVLADGHAALVEVEEQADTVAHFSRRLQILTRGHALTTTLGGGLRGATASLTHHTTPHHTTLPPTLCFAWTSLFTTGLYPHYLSTAAKEPHGELPSRMLQLAVGLGGLVGWVGLCLGARRMCGLAGERADAVCQVTMLIGCGMWIFIGAQIVHHIIMGGVYIM